MFSKNYLTFFLSIALFLAGGIAVLAQGAPVRGKVELKKADGTVVPVEGALIDAYRTDITAKFPSAKTNKKGEFVFASIPYGAKFAIAVSAPNIKADVYPNIKAGDEAVNVTVVEGDGKPLTEAEARQILASAPADQSSELTADQKAAQQKAQEEYQKKLAQNTEEKKKVDNINGVISRTLQEGDKQFNAKNYDAAIAQYDEGINADPDFAGSASILLNKKAVSLIVRATDKSNANANVEPAVRAQALVGIKKDYMDAVDALEKSLALIKTSTDTDPKVVKNFAEVKRSDLEKRKEAYRLMARTGADRTKGKEALAAFQEFIEATTDPKVKTEAQDQLGNMLLDTNEYDLAISESQKILATDPNNVNALAIAGLSLVNVGYINNDKAKLQEGANYLQKFAEIAPDTNQYKADAKGLIETLKKESSVTPQKITKKKQ